MIDRIMEQFNAMDFSLPIQLPKYPRCLGVYMIVGENQETLYIGSSKLLCRRASHLTALQNDKKAGYSHLVAGKLREYQEQGKNASIRFLECSDYKKVEKQLIAELKPLWNKKK